MRDKNAKAKNAALKKKAYHEMTEEQRADYLAKKRKYSKENRVKKTAYRNKYNKENRQRVRCVQNEWHHKNKDKISKRRRARLLSDEKYRESIRDKSRRRRSWEKAPKEDVLEILKWENKWRAAGMAFCVFCEKKITCSEATVDHFYPLSLGGRHHLSNLSISCRSCNSKKSKKDPFLFIREFVFSDFESSVLI